MDNKIKSISSPKGEKLCPDDRSTVMQTFTPMASPPRLSVREHRKNYYNRSNVRQNAY